MIHQEISGPCRQCLTPPLLLHILTVMLFWRWSTLVSPIHQEISGTGLAPSASQLRLYCWPAERTCGTPTRRTDSGPTETENKPWGYVITEGYKRDVVYLGWPIAPSYTRPNGGEGRGLGVSANEYSCAHHVTWSPNKLWVSTSIFILYVETIGNRAIMSSALYKC